MKKQIFRKAALERLSSPEQLNQLMRVTTPKSWLSLMALGLLVVMAITWSVLGSLATHVKGEGIFLGTGGVKRVRAIGNSQITEVFVHVGDTVTTNQVIARMNQPALEYQIQLAQDALKGLKALRHTLRSFQREALFQTTHSPGSSNEPRHSSDSSQPFTFVSELIGETTSEIQRLQRQLDAISSVKSPYTGRIIELMIDAGDLVNLGDPLMSIELTPEADSASALRPLMSRLESLEAVIYVPATAGKEIREGMDVQISPLSMHKEAVGILRGTVRSIADFPATAAGMMRVLENENLVRHLSRGLTPIEVRVTLQQNPAGDYHWTFPGISERDISSGMLCQAAIQIRSRRPILLIFPFLEPLLKF